MATFNTDAFFSAAKRKDIPSLLAIAFEICGETEASEIAKNTTRMTDLAIKKMRTALGDVEAELEESDKAIDQAELDTDEVAEKMVAETEENEVTAIIKKGKKLISKGKEKKAKKLFKQHGLSGSEIKKLFTEGK